MGEPACIRIKFGRGVCGTSISEKRTLLVEDVHHFPGKFQFQVMHNRIE